jgi:hypothetical protein
MNNNIDLTLGPDYCSPSHISPATAKKIIDYKIHREEKKEENTWRSCCFVSDKRAIQYFSQLFIIAGVMAFSIVQMARLDSCDSQPYLGLLTLLIGLIIPNPKIKQN